MKLTPHFTLAEMTRTSTGVPNVPTAADLCRLRAVCSAVLEPWRERVGPLRVSSGYRSMRVNDAVGGSVKSQHLKGEAADVVPLRMERRKAWLVLVEMVRAGLPVDQAIIYESTGHIHVSHTADRTARRQLLVKQSDGTYTSWDSYPGKTTIP